MRVLFCCLPAHGHLYPLLPLAAALRDAGHDVRFGTGAGFVDRVRGLGFPTDAMGTSIPEASRLAAQRCPERSGRELGLIAFAEIAAAAAAADLRALLAERKPDLVVYEDTQFGAAVAARLAGIPAICHALSRQLPRTRRGGTSLLHCGGEPSFRAVAGHLAAEIAAMPSPAEVAAAIENLMP